MKNCFRRGIGYNEQRESEAAFRNSKVFASVILALSAFYPPLLDVAVNFCWKAVVVRHPTQIAPAVHRRHFDLVLFFPVEIFGIETI